jgi:hypothetical protein
MHDDKDIRAVGAVEFGANALGARRGGRRREPAQEKKRRDENVHGNGNRLGEHTSSFLSHG